MTTTTANFQNAKTKAEEILRENYITTPPVDFYEIARNEGLEIETKDFGDEFNNISGYIKPGIRTIYVNSRDSENRRKFTVAHELGHWLLHRNKLEEEPEKYAILYRIPLGRSSGDPVEQEANCFAANLLVPEALLAERMTHAHTEEQLSQEFMVSKDVIGYRVANLESRATAKNGRPN